MSGRTTTVLDIRELLRHLQQGQSGHAIHVALGLSRRTISKYRTWAEKEGLLRDPLPSSEEIQARLVSLQSPAPPQVTSSVEPYRAIVQDLRERGVEIQAVYQRLRDEHGYRGTYASVWRFVRNLEPKEPEATVRIEVEPGEEAQVDFGYGGRMYDPVQRRVRRAWAFVMTLSWSRHQFIELVFDQKGPTWLELHRHAFEFLGGVPKRIVLDNLKAAIVQACWDDPQVQRAYRECAEHYGFLIAPCKPGTPEHKGKVESGGVHYVKRNLLAGRDYSSPQHNIHHANEDSLAWSLGTAGLRRHGTTKQMPLQQFEQVERAALLPLPPTPFETVTWKQAKLHRDCYIVFEDAYASGRVAGYYSAPHRLIGDPLSVRATAKSVQIYAGFELVATHSRATQPGQRQTLLAHLPPHKVAGVTLTPQNCLERAAAIGPHTHEVVSRLLAERPVDRLRAVQRLLARAENHGTGKLERACGRALDYEDVSLRTLHTILNTGIADIEAAEPVTYWPVFARPAEELLPASFRR